MVLRLDGVSFGWPDADLLLRDVHLDLTPGWWGVVGENGAGKSTLLGLLEGRLSPTAGVVRRAPGLRVAAAAQAVERPDAGVLGLALDGGGAARRLRGRLGLDPGRLFDGDGPDAVDGLPLPGWATLSGGERKRWQVGAALVDAPEVLLLDEPGNHLDAEARAILLDALRGFRGVGVLVSHDRAVLDGLTDRTVRVHRGRVTVHPGGYGAARADWERREALARDARDRAQAEVRAAAARLHAARAAHAEAEASRSARHRARDRHDHDARGMGARTRADWAADRAGRSVGVRRAAAERAREAVPEGPPAPPPGAELYLGWTPCPRPVVTAAAGDIPAGGRPCLRGVELVVRRADRWRLVGPNGAGKTTLLTALRRDDLLWLPQELAEADVAADLAALQALPSEGRGRVLQLVAALGARPAALLASAAPSPGEARKLRLALGLGRRVPALLLDEPTNHLDLPSVERLERALSAWPGALVLVTHDDRFAAAVGATAVDVTRWSV